MKKLMLLLLPALVAVPLFAQKDANARLEAATSVMNEMMKASDKGIPQDLLAKAECVVVIPNLKKGGFIVGAKYGKGFFPAVKIKVRAGRRQRALLPREEALVSSSGAPKPTSSCW